MGNNNAEKKFTRYTTLIVIMVLIFTAIISRLFFLQVVKGEEFKEQANDSCIREITDAAPRGKIIDKNGTQLAVNSKSYVLVYNPTDESNKVIFQTLEKVFKILDENGESAKDDFELKINPFSFQFNVDDEKTRKSLETRFKRDRGLHEEIEKKLYDKKTYKSEKKDNKKVNEELLKINAEETFEKLAKKYKIDTNKYDLKDQRRFMLVLDSMKMQSFSVYKAVTIANIKQETAFKFLQVLNDLPGIDVSTQPIRTYPNGELGSAFLGYISKIGTDKEKYQDMGYDINNDYIGSSGIEAVFEDRLKGSKGGRIVKLNKQGRVMEELGKREAYPGQTIQLTIDKDIQEAAEKALDKAMANLRDNPMRGDVNTSNATRGAAIAINVNTGAILALASRPGFDPNWFTETGGLKSDLYKQYFAPDLGEFGKQYVTKHGLTSYYQGKTLEEVVDILFPLDKNIKNNTKIRQDLYDIYPKPFYNYATQSMVPPGSTFKPMTAIAGLEEGVITPDYTIQDNGHFDIGGGHLINFAVGGYGSVNLAKGLEVSSNPYFMNVGKLLRESGGEDSLAKYAWKFGLGVSPDSKEKRTTGIEIPERFGQVYNSYNAKDTYANLYSYEIMNTLKNGESNRGKKFTPINLYDGDKDSEKTKKLKVEIKKAIQESIKEGDKAFDKKAYKKMFSTLIEESPEYKDKNIAEKDIDTMIEIIHYIAVSDANSQIRVGANMYNASIGQGMSQFTPLQLANYTATIANGGTRYKVHLVDKILDSNNKLIQEFKPEIIEKTGVSEANLEAVKYGMSLVNAGEDGTAAEAFKGFNTKAAGKTGSATFSTEQDKFGRTSSGVYIGFAPYEKPEIAVAVMVFDGGHGGFVAPVARAMYDAYFKQNNNNSQNSGQNTQNNQ